jgi:hypothetical protein
VELTIRLARLHDQARLRIEAQISAGTRPATAGSESEIDFGFAVAAQTGGVDDLLIETWLAGRRPEKARAYAGRTVAAALRYSKGLENWAADTFVFRRN